MPGGTAVVTGAAGFLGSHFADALLADGWRVFGLDNFVTGARENLPDDPRFTLIERDVAGPGGESWVAGLPVKAGLVAHLASPASPRAYREHPRTTLRAGSVGTLNALEYAAASGARFLLASTSEIYGSPAVHPQPESYWGWVNPVGERAVYDEAKRFAEAATAEYRRSDGNAAIVRIFNTYGPRMRPDDGRLIPALLAAARAGAPLPIHGTGRQTRSVCYVSDLVDGLLRIAGDRTFAGVVNLGNPEEMKVVEIARAVSRAVGVTHRVRHLLLPPDDPPRRCPDITRARTELGWEPVVPLATGLRRMLAS